MLTRFHSMVLFAIASILFLVVVTFTFRQVDPTALFVTVSATALFMNTVLGVAYFLTFGAIMKIGFRQQYNLSIAPIEVLTLPLMMHLFTYIVPVKGGLLFQAFYMKHRYQLDLNKGFSLGIMVFLIFLCLTVIIGLFLNFWLELNSGPLLSCLLLMALALAVLPVALKVVPSQHRKGTTGISRFINFLIDVRNQLQAQLHHPRLLVQISAGAAVSVVIQALWYQQSGALLGYQSSFLPMLLISLVLRVVLLLRLLPGNLGLQELMFAVTFAAVGFTIEEGLLIALITRFVSVVLASTIGLAGLYSNLKYFHLDSARPISAMVSGVKSG